MQHLPAIAASFGTTAALNHEPAGLPVHGFMKPVLARYGASVSILRETDIYGSRS
jgi:hypothetical protein